MNECLIETQNCEPTFIPLGSLEEYPLYDFIDFDKGTKFAGAMILRFPDQPTQTLHGHILLGSEGIEFIED